LKLLIRVLSVGLILVGLIWILQGITVLPESFMTGQMQWAYRGAVAAVIGAAILFFTERRRK
jgi:hypothetical protein